MAAQLTEPGAKFAETLPIRTDNQYKGALDQLGSARQRLEWRRFHKYPKESLEADVAMLEKAIKEYEATQGTPVSALNALYRETFYSDGLLPESGDYNSTECNFHGYTNGDEWNGWATPRFTREEALRLMESMNKLGYQGGRYLPDLDAFETNDGGEDWEDAEENGYIDRWAGEDYETVDGKLHLYPIGAYSWCWEINHGEEG